MIIYIISMGHFLRNSLTVCVILITTGCGTTQLDQTSEIATSPTILVTPEVSNSSIINQASIAPTPTATSTTSTVQPTSQVNLSNTSSQTKSPVATTASLKKYLDGFSGFSIQYPADGRIVENSKTSNSSSFIVSNIPDSQEMPGTVKWLESRKKLPTGSYTVEISIGERTDSSKLNDTGNEEVETEGDNFGFSLPKPQMGQGLPWNVCGGSVIPSTRHVIDGIEGFGGSLLVTSESAGFYGHSYCFRKDKPGDDVQYYQILIRINEKDPSQKLNKLLFPTIRFK